MCAPLTLAGLFTSIRRQKDLALLRQQAFPLVVAAMSSFSCRCGNNDLRLGFSEQERAVIRLLECSTGKNTGVRQAHQPNSIYAYAVDPNGPMDNWGVFETTSPFPWDGAVRKSRLAFGLSSPWKTNRNSTSELCQMSQGLLCFASITVISSEWTEQTDACLEVGSDPMVLKLERLRSPRSINKRVLKLEFEDETPPNISRKMLSVTSYLTCISKEWATTLSYSDPWFLPYNRLYLPIITRATADCTTPQLCSQLNSSTSVGRGGSHIWGAKNDGPVPNRIVVINPDGFRDSVCCDAPFDPSEVQKFEQFGETTTNSRRDFVVHKHLR